MLTGSPFFHAAPTAPQCPSLSPDAPTLACLQPHIEAMHMRKLLLEQNRKTDILRPQQQDIQRFMSIEAHKHVTGGAGMVQNRFIAQEPNIGFGVITVPNENAAQYNHMMEQMKRELEASGQLTTPNPSGILLHEKLQQERQSGLSEFVEQNNRNAKDAINLTRRWMGLPPLADDERRNDEPTTDAGRKDRGSACAEHAASLEASTGDTLDSAGQPAPLQPKPAELDISSLLVVSGPPPSILRYPAPAYGQGPYTGVVEASSFSANTSAPQQEADEQFQLQRLVEVQNQKISYLEQLLEQKKAEYYSGFGSSVPESFPYGSGTSLPFASTAHELALSDSDVQSGPSSAWEQPESTAKAPSKLERQREFKKQQKKVEAKTSSRLASHESSHSQGSKEADLDEALRRFVSARAALPVERCLRRVQRGVYFLGNVKMLAKRGQNGNILCMAQHAVGNSKVAVGELGKKFVSLERFWAHFCKHLETA
ncbi:hypothetical protein CSUI_001592 [Cystoisospora suis]|uniref:Uncharacterized protein n=1 Tax=Cystoisospora suis TaxID=483139 RepID=A0A2C6LB59_9APIC|nr:hypothetical protein CSUI_001592 [Cystoisospora suis]